MTESIDWMGRAVESETAYSVARGGVATHYGNFIHIMNAAVPVGGDYNRAVAVRVSSLEEFSDVVAQVRAIHNELGLQEPDSYDTYPALGGDGEWVDRLGEIGHTGWRDYFLSMEVTERKLPRRYVWRPVDEEEYLAWRRGQRQSEGWFDQVEWDLQLASERRFLRVYAPFWLLEEGRRVAWVHCANLGGYFRLFDVEVDRALHGQGYGRALLLAVEAEASAQGVSHILIRCSERLRGFYRACGFTERCSGTVIRLRADT